MLYLSFYRFFPLEGVRARREEIRAFGLSLGLRGTVLLAPEGINGMLTGDVAGIRAFSAYLEEMGVSDQKILPTPAHAFTRLLVKVKKEIISVGRNVSPAERTARRLTASELKRSLDTGEEMVLLDTRNEYEVAVGSFRGAESLKLDSSREFAARAEERKDAWAGKKVVTFCTGGIRCEKASAVLLELGLEDVYQLDGGILRYFERNGGAHFEGNCFVFDWRLAVDGELEPVPRSADGAASFGRHRVEE